MPDSLREMCQTLTLLRADHLLLYGIQLRHVQRHTSSNYGEKKGFEN